MSPAQIAAATRKTPVDLAKCPSVLKQLVEREGNFVRAAEKAGLSKYTLREIGNGSRAMTKEVEAKVTAALENKPNGKHQEPPPMNTQAAQSYEGPKSYPEWDGKRRNAKTFSAGGSETITKNLPGPLADLFDKIGGRKVNVARAVGYSGWSAVEPYIANDKKYRTRLHAKVMAALAGDLPLAPPEPTQEPDTYKLDLAIVILSLSEYERVDEMANILGGTRLFRKSTKAGWLLLFKFPTREKTEQFKRLAKRDTHEIVCP